MIFVTLGTQDKSFDRLLKAVEKAIKNKEIKDKVIVQAGYTKFKSQYMEIFDLLPMDEFNKYIKECDILITHGGVGSILTGLTNNKKVIATPRLSKYKEHTNDHQIQIVSEFYKRGYILAVEDLSKIGQVIKDARKFKPKKYKSNNENMRKLITNYIEEENNVSWFNKLSNVIMNGFLGPINYLLWIFICFLFYKVGCNLYFGNIISGILIMLLTYFIYKDDFTNTNKIKYFLCRLFYVFLDTFLFEFLMLSSSLYKARILTIFVVMIVSFITSYTLYILSKD